VGGVARDTGRNRERVADRGAPAGCPRTRSAAQTHPLRACPPNAPIISSPRRQALSLSAQRAAHYVADDGERLSPRTSVVGLGNRSISKITTGDRSQRAPRPQRPVCWTSTASSAHLNSVRSNRVSLLLGVWASRLLHVLVEGLGERVELPLFVGADVVLGARSPRLARCMRPASAARRAGNHPAVPRARPRPPRGRHGTTPLRGGECRAVETNNCRSVIAVYRLVRPRPEQQTCLQPNSANVRHDLAMR